MGIWVVDVNWWVLDLVCGNVMRVGVLNVVMFELVEVLEVL